MTPVGISLNSCYDVHLMAWDQTYSVMGYFKILFEENQYLNIVYEPYHLNASEMCHSVLGCMKKNSTRISQNEQQHSFLPQL